MENRSHRQSDSLVSVLDRCTCDDVLQCKSCIRPWSQLGIPLLPLSIFSSPSSELYCGARLSSLVQSVNDLSIGASPRSCQGSGSLDLALLDRSWLCRLIDDAQSINV